MTFAEDHPIIPAKTGTSINLAERWWPETPAFARDQ